jgi:DNA polymerase III subunit gamma/tau
MTFQVTARKWRPQKFSDVVGQEHITSTLKNAIKENRVAHAYLFTGPRGVGKTTTARILAKALNCQNLKDSEPCNECEMCKSISSTQLMDIIEIDGASNRGIDEIRTLRESVKYAPTRGKYKIYIIDEVHMLTKESFNAFLKTLEEPPAHTVFIFATTDIHKVPLTIISRCQRYDFRRIQLDTIKNTLAKIAKEEKIKIDDKTLTIISKKADGALRDAESYFDQVIAYCNGKINAEIVSQMLNLIDEEIFFKISDAVLAKDFKTVFEVSNTVFENGWDFLDFIDGLNEHFRNILTVVVTEKPDLAETAEDYKNMYLDYKDKFSESDLLRLMGFLNKTQQELKYSQNQKLKIEIALSHLVGLERTQTLSNLISNVSGDTIPDVSGQKNLNQNLFNKSSGTKTGSSEKTFQSSQINEPINIPEIKTVVQFPVSSEDLDFNKVVSMWQGFVNIINSEKGFLLGPALEKLKPVKLTGNQLDVKFIDAESQKTFGMHEKYIEQKCEDYFGKRLRFNSTTEKKTLINPESKQSSKTIKTDDPDQYEQIILNELGGQKIE